MQKVVLRYMQQSGDVRSFLAFDNSIFNQFSRRFQSGVADHIRNAFSPHRAFFDLRLEFVICERALAFYPLDKPMHG